MIFPRPTSEAYRNYSLVCKSLSLSYVQTICLLGAAIDRKHILLLLFQVYPLKNKTRCICETDAIHNIGKLQYGYYLYSKADQRSFKSRSKVIYFDLQSNLQS